MMLDINPGKWIIHDQIDSTNAYALRNKDLPSGSVIIAKDQTAGRGRMGRTWKSIPGNSLLFTGVLHIDITIVSLDRLRYLPLAAGLAVIKALESIAGSDTGAETKKLSLKWPNDIYMFSGERTGKLAGILIETQTLDENILMCALGIGLNWKGSFPEIDDESISPVSFFSDSDSDRDVMELVSPLTAHLNALIEKIMYSEELSFLNEIRSHFYLQNKIVSLSDGNYSVMGMHDDGGLLLKSLKDGKERVLYDTSEKISVENGG